MKMKGPHRHRHRSRPRGFMLFEMLIALGVLAAFALIAVKLLTTSLRLAHDAGAARDRALRFESAVGVLRADVWGAAGVELPAPGTARITLGDGSIAVWSADAQGALSRTLTAPAGDGYPDRLEWAALAPPGLAFERADGVLLLVEPPPPPHPRPRRGPAAEADAPPAEPRRVPIVSQVSPSGRKERP
jgi:hypothetical protein